MNVAAASNPASAGSSYRGAESRPAPANGIESLIQASVLAEEEQPANDTCVHYYYLYFQDLV